LAAAVVLDELPGEVLLVGRDFALADLLPEHLHEDVTGDVRRIRRARRTRGAERALRNPAVLRAREDRAPVFELVNVAGRLVAEDLDRILVTEEVGALDGVEGVELGVVLRGVAERRPGAAARGARLPARR